MKSTSLSVVCALSLVSALASAQGQGPARRSSITGDVTIHENFESKALGNKRSLRVYLPPQYKSEPNRKFPVLYMHDGQNCFDGMTSYIPNEEWRADEAAESLIGAGLIEPIIIVAIDNGGAARGDEYLPTKVGPGANAYGGKAPLYTQFVTDEVMPWVNKTYRTLTGPRNTALMGSSFGGVITCYMGMKRPDLFGKLAIMSPSVWVDNRVLLKMVPAEENRPKKDRPLVWVDMGTREGAQGVKDARDLSAAYASAGWKEGKNLWFYVDGHAEHNERAWASRIDTVLRLFFPKK